MFGRWHPPGTFPGGVYELNLLGSIGLAGIVFVVVYLPGRWAAKRVRKRGFEEGFAKAADDPDVFIKALQKARDAGIIREHIIVEDPDKKDETKVEAGSAG